MRPTPGVGPGKAGGRSRGTAAAPPPSTRPRPGRGGRLARLDTRRRRGCGGRSRLIDVGDADAQAYAEGIHRGGTLLTVRVEAALSERVREILEQDEDVATPSRDDDRLSMERDGTLPGEESVKGSVTGIAVFSDPTMPAPKHAGPVPSGPDAPNVEITRQPEPGPTTGLGSAMGGEATFDAGTLSTAVSSVDPRPGEAIPDSRRRVRIDDRP